MSKSEVIARVDIAIDDLEDSGGLLQPGQSNMCPTGMRFDAASGRCVLKREAASKRDRYGKGGKRKRRVDGLGAGLGLSGGTFEDVHVPEELAELDDEIRRREEGDFDSGDSTRDFDLQPLGNRSTPGHEDPFLLSELRIARAMAGAAFETADNDILPLYKTILRIEEAQNFDQVAFSEATEEADRIWRNTTFQRSEDVVTREMVASFRTGEAQVSAGIAEGSPGVQKVLDSMGEVNSFRTNEFFNTQIVPALQREVGKFVAGEEASIATIRGVLDRRLKSVPYWRVVANASASRIYHYGLVKAASLQGMTTVSFQAVLDGATSDICREVNGTQWHLPDAVRLMEQVASSPDPEEVKRLMPWVRFSDIEGLGGNSAALRDMGVMVPPLHGNCRSTLIVG